MSNALNLLVLMAMGVIVADLVAGGHLAGTNAILKGVADFWGAGVRGMLGQTSALTPLPAG